MGMLYRLYPLAEFRRGRRTRSSSRRRIAPHKRRLKSGEVVQVGRGGGSAKGSSPALRNVELGARSVRSLTYSADTIQRMAQRGRKAAREISRARGLRSLGPGLTTASKESRQWVGTAARGLGEARKW
jgi:hypothetical protein